MKYQVIKGHLHVQVEKAHGVWAWIQYWWWVICCRKSKKDVEVAMVDAWCKKIVTRRGDDGYIPIHLYWHEEGHILQIELMGKFKFMAVHTWYNIRYGYSKNPLELEAKAYAEKKLNEHLNLP